MAGSSNGRTPGYDPGNERFESSTRNHRKEVHSMKFIRLTSVFLCCALLSSFLLLPASAVVDDNYYSLSPVSSAELSPSIDWSVSPAVEHDYTTQLGNIQINQQTQTNILQSIQAGVQAVNVWLGKIEGHTSRIKDYTSILSSISSAVGLLATEKTVSAISDKVATEITLSDFADSFKKGFTGKGYSSGTWTDAWPYEVYFTAPDNIDYRYYGSFGDMFARSFQNMFFDTNSYFELTSADGKTKSYFNGPTIYRMIKLLQETLASEDDRQLAENYKDNRKQAEQDFLNGSSGKTSLGKDDFGSLSSVGGTFKDTISLNGQSSLSDLTSGLADADTAGQGWFSQATKDSLDAVSGSGSSESTISTFSDDGLYSVDIDPDPYHMQGFEDNYAWLWGDDDG
jgi:hypothetical protein